MNLKKTISIMLALVMVGALLAGCSAPAPSASESASSAPSEAAQPSTAAEGDQLADQAKTDMSKADESADEYVPAKKDYYFYVTYKLVHNWYDAIYSGIKAAVAEYADQGINIKVDWEAPIEPDAVDQVNRIESAVGKKPDVIVVDFTQNETTVPAINAAVEAGIPVMTFAGSDVTPAEGCNRTAFVGNVDNYGDGAALAEALCKALDYKGQVAILSGTIGAPSHEQRLQAFKDVFAKYPDIEVVDEQRDNDFVENAVQITETFLQKYPDLKGIIANNMSNPIGACTAVKDAGLSGKVLVAGMDHDLRTLNFLKDGTLLCAQVQNCYDMGYFMVKTAVKIADGLKPGDDTYPEVYGVGSTTVYKEDADKYIDLLFPDAE